MHCTVLWHFAVGVGVAALWPGMGQYCCPCLVGTACTLMPIIPKAARAPSNAHGTVRTIRLHGNQHPTCPRNHLHLRSYGHPCPGKLSRKATNRPLSRRAHCVQRTRERTTGILAGAPPRHCRRGVPRNCIDESKPPTASWNTLPVTQTQEHWVLGGRTKVHMFLALVDPFYCGVGDYFW